MNAHHTNASWRLVLEEIFDKAEYFITHKYNKLDRMFAYIWKIDRYEIDDYGQIYFNRYGSFQFIEVISIDRCVGFFKIENVFYILDRERI